MQIRSARTYDTDSLMKIDSECFLEGWKEKDWIGFLSMPQYHCYIMEDERGIKGFLLISSAADEGEIIKIAVYPQFQGQGLAAYMLTRAFGDWKLQGVKYLFLEVRRSNRSARTLYEKQGFKEAGIRNHYYQNPAEDAVIYTKQLV